jgi:hypothetical protein
MGLHGNIRRNLNRYKLSISTGASRFALRQPANCDLMDKPSPTVRALAERLLAVEAASQYSADAHSPEAVRVITKLRISLTRFAGPEGFASLLRRALTLAGAEVPALRTVKLNPDGSLEGFQKGVIIGEPLRGYRGLTSGIPGPWSSEPRENDPSPRPAKSKEVSASVSKATKLKSTRRKKGP